MQAQSLDSVLSDHGAVLRRGPVAMIFAEDAVEVGSTLAHWRRLGFAAVLLFAPPALRLPPGAGEAAPRPGRRLGQAFRIDLDTSDPGLPFAVVNRLIAALPGVWLSYAYNAEYLFYPFCETRSVGEMLAFHAEERREAMLTYTVDLYAADLTRAPNAVSLEDAHLDRSGYYALARTDAAGHPRERQLDFFGGLRWRFEEHVPAHRRRIDRIALFRAKPGLTLRPDHTLSDEEMNTFSCPWHHNLTAAICSFRVAKALRLNPGSRDAIRSFRWHGSERFRWHSQQLMDLGLMEPGQWF